MMITVIFSSKNY